MTNTKVRIGIDVGGTFTHAVALNAQSLEIIGRAKVPTTHTAAHGVAKGIIDALQELLQTCAIDARDVNFIAHSTTQATNALLEGDVAAVGILCLSEKAHGFMARLSTRLGKIELAPLKYLITYYRFLDGHQSNDDAAIRKALTELVSEGAQAIAITQAFSVDNATAELKALNIAHDMKLLATAGSQVSQLYGLKVRTRTAVINAAMLPKMIETADMTEKSVREAGITAPLMIMRSDGGVMDIDAMRKRPILTMLSGPAAGVAAAMMFLKISDGVFMEVGGTSTDISAISNGRAQIKSGEVGRHRVYMRTLDVRTVGVAGGSMPRISATEIIDVGPRSAHIAGLQYVAFSERTGDLQIETIQPGADDPADYLAISEAGQDTKLCLTPTCAANFLNLVPANDCASGNKEHIEAAFAALSAKLAGPAQQLATQLLKAAAQKCIPVVKQLIKDHKLDANIVTLVGGGGGAAAIVPFVAAELHMPHNLAREADVISAIGVALALIRETVERQIINPTNDDILLIRNDAFAAVHKMGADPASIEIHVEIDTRTAVVRATAYGATSMVGEKDLSSGRSQEEKMQLLGQSLRAAPEAIELIAETDYFQVFSAVWIEKHLFGLLCSQKRALRILDIAGSIRWQIQNGVAIKTSAKEVATQMSKIVEEHSQWGDAGRIIPDILLISGSKIIDLSGLLNIDQLSALAKVELDGVPENSAVIVVAKFP